MERDISRIETQLSDVTSQIAGWQSAMSREITELKTLVREHPVLCPYRERIAAVGQNAKDIEHERARIDRMEQALQRLELVVARSGAVGGLAGGGTVGVLGAVVFAVGKAAGWW